MIASIINNKRKIKKIFPVLLSFLFFAAVLFGNNPIKINMALADGAWFNDGSGTTWSNRFMITPSSVASGLVYDLSLAPASFWNSVRSDGGDIRVTAEDGTTQLAREVSGFDYAGHKGSLFFGAGSMNNFIAIGETHRTWNAVTVAPNGDVYAAEYAGYIYKQAGGVGSFVAVAGTSGGWAGLCAAPNGDIYAAAYSGDIFKQTGGTGAFNSLAQGSLAWESLAATGGGDIYVVVYGGGIYKQTGGAGNFNSLGQTSRNWVGVTVAPNGDVYASVANGDIYKQVAGAGNFIATGQVSRNYQGMAAAPNGNIYAAVLGDDIYEKINGTDYFVPLGQGVKNWRNMTARGNSVWCVTNGDDIFKQTNDEAFFIYYGNPAATEPAANATYGKYAAHEAAKQASMHLEDGNDSTSQQNNALSVTGTLTDAKVQKGYALNGSSDYINLPDINAIDGATALTVKAWIYSASYGGNQGIVVKWDYATQGNFGFQTGATGNHKLSLYLATSLTDDGNGCRIDTTNDVLANGEYARVAFVFDGSLTGNANRLKMYVNGQPVAMTQGAGNVPAALTSGGTASVWVGAFNGLGRYFNGIIDQVDIDTRAFSASEMATDYANQSNPASFWTTGGEEASLAAIGATTGTTTVGSVLTAGLLTPGGATVGYQWYNCTTSSSASCTASISGATSSTYTLQTSDLGDYVAVTATGTGSYIGSVTSTPVGIVTASLVSVGATTGTTTIGSVLTAGSLTPSGAAGNVTYQWQKSSTSGGAYSNISLATSSTYTVESSDVGYYIQVQVTGTGNYSGTVTSSYVGPVTILVTGITVTGAGSATSVLSGGTLQMSASVLPFDATNQTVTWSVTDGTGSATINSTSGLLTAVSVGTVTVTASATDGSGVTGAEVITVAVAPSAPSLVSPANGSYTNNTTPTLSASYYNSTTGDIGKTNYRIDSSSSSDCVASSPSSVVASGASVTTSSNSQNTTWTSSALTNGTYYWCAQNEELSGGFTSSWTSMGTFVVDTTTPSGGEISYINGYVTVASVLIAYTTGSDSGSGLNNSLGEIQRASATLSNGSCGTFSSFTNLHQGYNDSPYSDTSVSDGNCYKYQYVISDNASNQATYSPISTSVVKVDLTAPVTTALMTTSSGSYSSGIWINQNVTVNLSNCADSQSGCHATYYCDDSSTCTDWSVYSDPQIISTNGTTTFRYYSINNAGNPEPIKSQTIKVDATTPTTSDNFTGSGAWIDANPTITLYPAVNDISGLAWTRYCEDTNLTCDPSQGTDYNTPVLIAPVSTPSTSYFRYASADNAGNIQTTVSLTVMIDTGPQVTQVLINPVNVSSPPTASSSVTITNEGRFNYEYQYAWCVVTSSSIPCNLGGTYINGADSRVIFYGSNAKNINAGDDFITTLSATVSTAGTYYFEVVTYYDDNQSSSAFQQFTIGSSTPAPAPSGGSGGGGGTPIATGTYDAATAKANSPDINTDKGLPNAPPFTAWCVSGSLIKGSFQGVYYCGTDGKRYVFVNDKVYFSWYPDFSTVKTIANETLALIPLGGNVTYRPGVRLVKIQSDPKVYAIARGGVLRWIMTEAAAARLYGANWNKMIDDISDSFFVNYKIGEPISE